MARKLFVVARGNVTAYEALRRSIGREAEVEIIYDRRAEEAVRAASSGWRASWRHRPAPPEPPVDTTDAGRRRHAIAEELRSKGWAVVRAGTPPAAPQPAHPAHPGAPQPRPHALVREESAPVPRPPRRPSPDRRESAPLATDGEARPVPVARDDGREPEPSPGAERDKTAQMRDAGRRAGGAFFRRDGGAPPGAAKAPTGARPDPQPPGRDKLDGPHGLDEAETSPVEPFPVPGRIDRGPRAETARVDPVPARAPDTRIDLPVLGDTIRHVLFVILGLAALVVVASCVVILMLF